MRLLRVVVCLLRVLAACIFFVCQFAEGDVRRNPLAMGSASVAALLGLLARLLMCVREPLIFRIRMFLLLVDLLIPLKRGDVVERFTRESVLATLELRFCEEEGECFCPWTFVLWWPGIHLWLL